MNNDKQPEENSSPVTSQVEEFLEAWLTVRQQIQALNFNRAHQHGMSMTQFMVLNLLDEAQTATIGGLAARMNLDPATVVRCVDSLENRGLVERRRDKKDRRVVFVEFSEEGRKTQQSLNLIFKNRLGDIFSSMSEEGRLALIQGLQEFVAAVRQQDI